MKDDDNPRRTWLLWCPPAVLPLHLHTPTHMPYYPNPTPHTPPTSSTPTPSPHSHLLHAPRFHPTPHTLTAASVSTCFSPTILLAAYPCAVLTLLLPQQPRTTAPPRASPVAVPAPRPVEQQRRTELLDGMACVPRRLSAEGSFRVSFCCSGWVVSPVPSWPGRPRYVPDVLMN